jgi:hypothetical protein
MQADARRFPGVGLVWFMVQFFFWKIICLRQAGGYSYMASCMEFPIQLFLYAGENPQYM